jgi:hypothetical protein
VRCIYDVDYNWVMMMMTMRIIYLMMMMMNVVQKMTEERIFAVLSRHVSSIRCTGGDDDDDVQYSRIAI